MPPNNERRGTGWLTAVGNQNAAQIIYLPEVPVQVSVQMYQELPSRSSDFKHHLRVFHLQLLRRKILDDSRDGFSQLSYARAELPPGHSSQAEFKLSIPFVR